MIGLLAVVYALTGPLALGFAWNKFRIMNDAEVVEPENEHEQRYTVLRDSDVKELADENRCEVTGVA